MKKELRRCQRVLRADYPECLEGQMEDEEVVDGEVEEQTKRSREAVMKIILYFLRNMKKEELADSLQNSKELLRVLKLLCKIFYSL